MNFALDVIGQHGVAVLEPVSWALMLLGFGGIGVTLRNRRRLVSVAA